MLTLGQAIERYDAEIAHCDSSVEQVAGTLKELGILDRTLIIVVSDSRSFSAVELSACQRPYDRVNQ